jgi:hypothetical protein
MWCRVYIVLTDFLEERIASICSCWFLARGLSSFFFYSEDGGDTCMSTCSRWFLARGFSSFFFYPEDGSDTFLRNVG